MAKMVCLSLFVLALILHSRGVAARPINASTAVPTEKSTVDVPGEGTAATGYDKECEDLQKDREECSILGKAMYDRIHTDYIYTQDIDEEP